MPLCGGPGPSLVFHASIPLVPVSTGLVNGGLFVFRPGAWKGGKMNRKQYSFMLVLALVAGLVGGVISSRYFEGQPVAAAPQKVVVGEPTPKKVIEAEEFRVVNKEKKVLATLTYQEERGGVIELFCKGGKPNAYYARVGCGGLSFYNADNSFSRKHYSRNSFRVGQNDEHIEFFQGIKGISDHPRLTLTTKNGSDRSTIGFSIKEKGEPSIYIYGGGSGSIDFSIKENGEPSIVIVGKDGRGTVIGCTETVTIETGEKHTTSVNSILMIDNERKIIWSAP